MQYQAAIASFFQEVHRLAANLSVLTPNLDTKWQHKAHHPLSPVAKMGICHPRKKERKKEIHEESARLMTRRNRR